MIKAIIFDYGGVILSKDASVHVTRDLSETLGITEQEAHVFYEADEANLSEGRITGVKFIQKILDGLMQKGDANFLFNKWVEISAVKESDINWDLLDLIKKLKENYKLYLFTDSIDAHVLRYKGTEVFDHVFKSYEEGYKKPDPKSYQNILSKIGLDASEVIFIDDRLNNIREGEKLGIKGIVFENNEKLKNDLLSFGIVL